MGQGRANNLNQRDHQYQNGYNQQQRPNMQSYNQQNNNYYQQNVYNRQDNQSMNNVYLQSGYNYTPNYYEKQEYIEMKNTYVWLLVCVPVVSLVMNIICVLIGISITPVDILMLVINTILFILDYGEVWRVKTSGGWVVWGFLVIPVYLYMRAKKTDHKYSYFIAWICSWLGCTFIQWLILVLLQIAV